MEKWKIGRLEKWNVEELAEIPLRREKNGRVEELKIKKDFLEYNFEC